MADHVHDPSSTSRLRPGGAVHFSGERLFDRVARAVCEANCLPRKELYESWEVACRARKRLRGRRVVDLAAGHGLVAYLMLLLEPRYESALAVDRKTPLSAGRLAEMFETRWPQLAGRVERLRVRIETVELRPDDVVVSAHACGRLTDKVLNAAMAANVDVAVLPCCHSHRNCDQGGLQGWLPPDVAIDVVRAGRLRAAGYSVWTQTIPASITPKNRLLFGRAQRPMADEPAALA